MRGPANAQVSSIRRRIPRRLTRFDKGDTYEESRLAHHWELSRSRPCARRSGSRCGTQARRYRTESEQLSPLVERYGDQVRAVALDVTDERAAAAAVQTAVDSFGRLDVLVNNAGYGDLASIEDTSMKDFRAQIETNLFGVINVTKAALPLMRRQGSGHIMQFASVGGRIGPMGRGAYAAAKWGVEGFSEVLLKEVGPFGIKVTIIEPGGFRTDFAGASTNIAPENPIYATTVGATARFQREYNGKQPGDPARAAAALMQIAELEAPPLRLPLGSDAARAVEEAELARIASDKRWKELSMSTDFPPNA